MSKVVFILGAGASKQSGAPLMAEFLDVASDLFTKGEVQESKKEFELVFRARSYLQQVHSKARLDLNNIESIFTVLELAKVIRKFPRLKEDEIERAIKALKILIVKTLECTMLFKCRAGDDGKNIVEPDKSYELFATMLKDIKRQGQLTVSVITFNYDIGLDMAMELTSVRPSYIINTLGDEACNGDRIELMKLHGSLNWALDQDKEICAFPLRMCLPRHGLRLDDTKVTVGSDIQHLCKQHFQKDVDHEPVIVPPSWNKADYHTMVSPVWAAAARNLSEAEHIFIIGYSLPPTDSFFRHLYALGSAGDSLIRSIWVFNPDVSLQERFLGLIGPGAEDRYKYIGNNFISSIKDIRKRLTVKAN